MLLLRKILLPILLGATVKTVKAQSYLYIQSDKSTPIYVKVNGVMQQRYSKYYCIAANLKPGKTTIEILFQQNIFSPQTFIVNIPENGKVGYMLTRNGDIFALAETGTNNKVEASKTDNK